MKLENLKDNQELMGMGMVALALALIVMALWVWGIRNYHDINEGWVTIARKTRQIDDLTQYDKWKDDRWKALEKYLSLEYTDTSYFSKKKK